MAKIVIVRGGVVRDEPAGLKRTGSILLGRLLPRRSGLGALARLRLAAPEIGPERRRELLLSPARGDLPGRGQAGGRLLLLVHGAGWCGGPEPRSSHPIRRL